MAKKIKKEDIIEGSLLGSTIKETEELIRLINVLQKELNELRKDAKSGLKKNPLGSPEEIKRFNDEQTKANLLIKEGNRLRKAQATAQAKLKSLRSQENIQLQKTRLETQEQNRVIKQDIQLKKSQNGSIKQLRIQLSQLTKAYDNLSKAERESVKIGGAQLKQIQATQRELRELEQATGRAQRNVGNYGEAWKKVGTNLLRLSGVLGGAMIFRDAFTRVKDFEQAQADLGAISGKTADELAGLTQQAKDLGATTQFSASEITQLQIELAKLGFTTDQIAKSTGGIQNLAAATGSDLASAAKLAGSALRAFNLDASEADRVASTLGVATTKTALDMSQLEAGLSTVAPVAATFGFSIEETVALLGQLSNAGFDASSSATATRNILLNLADANGKLAKELGRPVKNVADLSKGLQELDKRGINLAETLELTDKRSVAAFNTFIKGSDSVIELTNSITNQNEALQEMAEKRLDTVTGSLKLLESAWEGFLIDLDNGVGAFNALKVGVKFVADNLRTIIRVLTIGATAWVSYKVGIIATNVAMRLHNTLLKTFGFLTNLATGKVKGFTNVFKALNTTVKANPLGLVITAITTLIGIIPLFASETEEATKKQEDFNDELEKTKGITDKLNEGLDELEEKYSDREIPLTDRLKADTDLILKNIKTLKDELPQLTLPQLKKDAQEVSELISRNLRFTVRLKELNEDTSEIDAQIKGYQELLATIKETIKAREDAASNQEKTLGLIEANEKALKELRKLEKEATSLEQLEKIRKKIDLLKEENLVLHSRVDILKDLKEEEDDTLFDDAEMEAQNKKRKSALERATDELEEVYNKDTENAQNAQDLQTEQLAQSIDERLQMEIEAAEARKMLARESADAALDYFKSVQQEKISLIDNEIEASKSKEQQLLDAANKGNALAEESIALERKNRAKLEEERLRSAKKIRNAELTLAGIRTLGAVAGAGSGNPALDTISQITLVTNFLKTLPAFIDGTEKVSDGVKGGVKISNGTDGYLARFDGRERIINPNDNEALSGLSNDELVKAGMIYKNGGFDYLNFKQKRYKSKNATDNSLMVAYAVNNMGSKLDEVNRSIKNIPSPKTEWNDVIKGISETTETFNNIKIKHYKPKNLM